MNYENLFLKTIKIDFIFRIFSLLLHFKAWKSFWVFFEYIEIKYKMNYIYRSHRYCLLQLGVDSLESVSYGLLMTVVSFPR